MAPRGIGKMAGHELRRIFLVQFKCPHWNRKRRRGIVELQAELVRASLSQRGGMLPQCSRPIAMFTARTWFAARVGGG